LKRRAIDLLLSLGPSSARTLPAASFSTNFCASTTRPRGTAAPSVVSATALSISAMAPRRQRRTWCSSLSIRLTTSSSRLSPIVASMAGESHGANTPRRSQD